MSKSLKNSIPDPTVLGYNQWINTGYCNLPQNYTKEIHLCDHPKAEQWLQESKRIVAVSTVLYINVTKYTHTYGAGRRKQKCSLFANITFF